MDEEEAKPSEGEGNHRNVSLRGFHDRYNTGNGPSCKGKWLALLLSLCIAVTLRNMTLEIRRSVGCVRPCCPKVTLWRRRRSSNLQA